MVFFVMILSNFRIIYIIDQRPSSKEVQAGGYYVIQKNGENPSTTTTSAPCSLFSYNTDQQPKYSTAGQLSSTGHSQGNITVSAPMQKTYINVISKSSTFPDSNTFVDVGHFTPHTTISSGNQVCLYLFRLRRYFSANLLNF